MVVIAEMAFESGLIESVNTFLVVAKKLLSLIGGFVILSGALYAIARFVIYLVKGSGKVIVGLDVIRLDLGRSIILGLEFIVASDVIETTTTPDYYALGILSILVLIRTFLSYFLNKELNKLSTTERSQLQ